ncbi:5'-methylthioadenosine phosphorylase [Marinobacter halodurans]|uniref:5'-methylthioadenosine phosphorylase n=1 Tax=Marinobacter halodurans TaxID=2528979 RepID=A0ABY1ZQG7_9GAMM|nr:CsiV family protein [Marinobacter halodurans]TBW59386.1 5'-methylthioadenosine phosphorylase [Marinobacter halodurans]
MQDFQTRWLAPMALAMALFSMAGKAAADDNVYRAELVLFERLGATDDIAEQMQTRRPETPRDVTRNLWVVGPGGQVNSDLNLVSRNNLYLSSAANRLENSGRYRVLMAAGWVQSFPPDYNGQPMRIALGDVIDQAGDRAIEGYIDIDRVRYLHVTAKLNQWREASEPTNTAGEEPATQDLGNNPYMPGGEAPSGPQDVAGDTHPDRELVTWLHQTRRMRSKEIHYLDSPTLGLLVYFQPLDGQ